MAAGEWYEKVRKRTVKNDQNLSGKSKRGLTNGGLAAKPERGESGQKGPFRGNFCASPVAVGCRGIGPDRPRKGPDRPWSGANSPRKGPIFQEVAFKDFRPIFSENLGLKPPFVSPCLDFPKETDSEKSAKKRSIIVANLTGSGLELAENLCPPPPHLVPQTHSKIVTLQRSYSHWKCGFVTKPEV